jgi:hypothetical protein
MFHPPDHHWAECLTCSLVIVKKLFARLLLQGTTALSSLRKGYASIAVYDE